MLKGRRKYQFAVDVVHPFRLIFKPKIKFLLKKVSKNLQRN